MNEHEYEQLEQLYYALNLDTLRVEITNHSTRRVIAGFKPHPIDGNNGFKTFNTALKNKAITMERFLDRLDSEHGKMAVRSPQFAIFCGFIDGCPSDWLKPGADDEWHTLVCCIFQLQKVCVR